jgi:hypothetical protein
VFPAVVRLNLTLKGNIIEVYQSPRVIAVKKNESLLVVDGNGTIVLPEDTEDAFDKAGELRTGSYDPVGVVDVGVGKQFWYREDTAVGQYRCLGTRASLIIRQGNSNLWDNGLAVCAR